MPRALLSLLLVAACGMAAPAEDRCDQSIPDKCLFDVLIIGNKDLDIPQNNEKMEAFCADVSKSEECLESYIERCMKSLQKQVATVFLKSVMKEVNDWCGSGREEFLSHSGCMATQKKPLDKCVVELIAMLKTITEAVHPDDIIPQACCSFNTFSECVVDAGQSVCSQDTVDFLDKMIQSYSSDLLDLVCAVYESGSEACNSLPPLPPRTNSTLPRTMLPPLLDMVKLL